MSDLCIICSSPLKGNAIKYCSYKCKYAWQYKLVWQKKKELFEKTGKWHNPCNAKVIENETVINRLSKRYLKETKGIQCEICGTTQWMDKEVPLVLDHIDGNSSNNSIENLRLVCGNCDMQLPTYKKKNYGNGRYMRRKRYANNQSF